MRPLERWARCSTPAEGLRRLPETRVPKPPRIADYALWATACETALWPAGTFWSAYCGNRDEAVEEVIDAHPIAAAERAVMAMRTEWTGTASDLLDALAKAAGERVAKSKTWPGSPRALAGRLKRAATFLRKIGVDVAFRRRPRADQDHPYRGRARAAGRDRPHGPHRPRPCQRSPAAMTSRLIARSRSLTPRGWRTILGRCCSARPCQPR
jgi:hypothetical protein